MEDVHVDKTALTKVHNELNFAFHLSFEDWYELLLPVVFLVVSCERLITWKCEAYTSQHPLHTHKLCSVFLKLLAYMHNLYFLKRGVLTLCCPLLFWVSFPLQTSGLLHLCDWIPTAPSFLCAPLTFLPSWEPFHHIASFFGDTVSCAPRQPWTYNPFLTVSTVLRLKACATKSNFINDFFPHRWGLILKVELPVFRISYFPSSTLIIAGPVSCFLSSQNDFNDYLGTENCFLVLPTPQLLESWTLDPDVH